MSVLADALLAHRPRETSGASSANRFDFQRTWALCHLLKLHEGQEDYVLILEFHDDVLVLDDGANPQWADFYQVKTKRGGQWLQREMLACRKSANKDRKRTTEPAADVESAEARSHLGKLLDHCRQFGSHVRSLNLVSNAPFKMSSTSPMHDREAFSLRELEPEALNQIKKAIAKELELDTEPPWDAVFLMTTPLSLDDHQTHATGALANFLERRQPGGRFAVKLLYRALCDELSRRATHEWMPASFEELCSRKGIRRVDLDRFLDTAHDTYDPETALSEIVEQLRTEGLPYRDLAEVKASWRRYDVDARDPSSTTFASFRDTTLGVVRTVHENPTWRTLVDFLKEAEASFVAWHGEPEHPFDRKYLRGALLYELKVHEAGQLPATHPKPAEGTP